MIYLVQQIKEIKQSSIDLSFDEFIDKYLEKFEEIKLECNYEVDVMKQSIILKEKPEEEIVFGFDQQPKKHPFPVEK